MSSIGYFQTREPAREGPCLFLYSELNAKLTYALECWFVDAFKPHGALPIVLGLDCDVLRNYKFSLPRLGMRAHALSSSAMLDPVSQQCVLTLACNISNILTGMIDDHFHGERLYVPRSEWFGTQINIGPEVSRREALKAHLVDDPRVCKMRSVWFFGRVSPEPGYFGPIWSNMWRDAYHAQMRSHSNARAHEGVHRMWLGEICGASKEIETCSRERMQFLVERVQKKTWLYNQEMRWIFAYSVVLHRERSYNELGPDLAKAVNGLVHRALLQGSDTYVSNVHWCLRTSFGECLFEVPSTWFSAQSFDRKERALLVHCLQWDCDRGVAIRLRDEKICAVTRRLPQHIALEMKVLSCVFSALPSIAEENESEKIGDRHV